MNDIKFRDANRILKKNGYTLMYVRGDHHNYVGPDGQRIVLPFHKNRNNECGHNIWTRTCRQYSIKY